MKAFLERHAEQVVGVLSGFDRMLFRGAIRSLAYAEGATVFLCQAGIKFTEFGDYVKRLSMRVKEASLAWGEAAGVKRLHLSSPKVSKDELARAAWQRDPARTGLIATFTSVEPCHTYELGRDPANGWLRLVRDRRPGMQVYHYFHHERFGLMHVRLSTWFPFDVHVCMNGRAWLARQMDLAGIGYRPFDNSFTGIGNGEPGDWAAAQRLMDEQLRTAWVEVLDGLMRQVHPLHAEIFAPPLDRDYYWVQAQSEWATDVTFRERATVQRLLARLTRHGLASYGPLDVVRFLGKRPRVRRDGTPLNVQNVVSNIYQHEEGTRIKHWHNDNSLKAYDKGTNLRFEETINNPADLKAYRPRHDDPDGPPVWQPLRKSVADIHRRAQVSQAGVNRMMDAYASADTTESLGELIAPLCEPVTVPGHLRADGTTTAPRRRRALQPLNPHDCSLLTAITRPEFAQNGLRNRDLCQLLFATATRPADAADSRRHCAAVSRQLSLLRAHGLLHKVPKTHRYVVPPAAHNIITTLLAARNANAIKLTQIAV